MSWYKNTYSLLMVSVLAFSSVSIANANSGMMHPLGNTQSVIQSDVGQVLNPDYGVINYNSSMVLSPEKHEKSKKYPVYTPYAGKVFFLEKDDNDKITLMILHKNGMKTTYSNLNKKDIAPFNAKLNKGDIIGYISSDDEAVAPTLEYELVEENGYAIKHQLTQGNRNNQNFIFSSGDLAMAFFNADPFKDKGSDTGSKITPWSPNNKSETQNQTIVKNNPSTPLLSYSAPETNAVQTASYNSTYNNSSNIDDVVQQTNNPLCPAPVHKSLLARSEAKLANQEKMREIVITEPASVNGSACFDQFATIMSTIVAESGASGAMNVFGFDIELGDLLELGANALAEGACDAANDLFNRARSNPNFNTLYAGFKRADTLMITQDPDVLSGVLPESVPSQFIDFFQPGARANVTGTNDSGVLEFESLSPLGHLSRIINREPYTINIHGTPVLITPPPPQCPVLRGINGDCPYDGYD